MGTKTAAFTTTAATGGHAAWDVALSISTTNLIATVTGEAARSIVWTVHGSFPYSA